MIPLFENLENIAATVISGKASEQADLNYASSVFPENGHGHGVATKQEAEAKKEEIKAFIKNAMAPPFHAAFWEMFTAIIAPIAAAIGIPYFVCKHTIAKMVVDNIMGKGELKLDWPTIPTTSAKIAEIVSSEDVDETLPTGVDLAPPKSKRG